MSAPEAGRYVGVLQSFREMPRGARFALLGVLVNQFGSFLQFFLVLYLTQRGFSAAQAGFALGAYAAGTIVGTLFGGGLSDRLGARWTIVFSISAAAVFTLAVTVLSSLAAIVVAVTLAGGVTQAARPAVAALLFQQVPKDRQVMAFAMYRTCRNAGAIGGPLVAVWLSTVSWNLVFYIDAASSLAYAAIAAFLIPAIRAAKDEHGDPDAGRRGSGYLTILHDLRYLAYLLLMLGNGLVHVQFFAVLPLMLDAAGYPPWAYGTLASISAVIVVSSELLVTTRTQRWAPWVAVLTGWTLLVFGRGALGLPGGLAVLVVGTLLAAVGQVTGGAQAFTYPAKVAPPALLGRYVGSAYAMFGIGGTLGPILGVLLWHTIGNTFWAVCFVVGLAMIVPGYWGMRAPERAAATAD